MRHPPLSRMSEHLSFRKKLDVIATLERDLGIFGSRFAFRDDMSRALYPADNEHRGATLYTEDVVDDVIACYQQMKADDASGITWQDVQMPA